MPDAESPFLSGGEPAESPAGEPAGLDAAGSIPETDAGAGQEEAPAGPAVIETTEAAETVEAAEAEEAETAWTPEPSKLFRALLFASQEYLSGRALKEIMGEDWDLASLRRLMKQSNRELEEQDQPFEIIEVDGTFRMRTRTQYYPWVRRLFKESSPRRLSQASLETLAIIAYKQPITKAEIEAIRGVNVDGCMKSLLEKKLVDVNGRADAMGGAFTYSTTREFMRYFGVNRVPDDLPRLTEFEAIVNAQALIPQIGPDGTVIEAEQPEPDGEQLSLDQLE
jgi:segregation and condensation protein B